MSLILRVDVDKPYGNSNLARKVSSKLVEDYWFPKSIYKSRYLSHLFEFLQLCNNEHIQGHIYFRTCTAPNEKIISLLKSGGHRIGFHAENTRSFETFSDELNNFKRMVYPLEVKSFSKHGSGALKLGRHHYPPYEPDKYNEWAKQLDIAFYFGNGICKTAKDFSVNNTFFPNMFWIEREYRDPAFSGLDKLMDLTVKYDTPVLIHPCNYHASKIVANDFKEIIKLSREYKVDWKVLD